MSSPLISILMPSYNHENYVEDAVRSVLAQDWPRIELVVVDDGSRDGTWDVLQRLRAECESRLERVEMERQGNRGTAETVCRLLSQAHGDYVGILASDDQYLPGALTALSAVLSRNPDVGVVVGENELMDANGRRCYWDSDRRIVYDPAQAVYRTLNEQMASINGVSGRHPGYGTYRELLVSDHVANGALIRRRCLDRTVPLSRSTPLEDWWMMMQLSKVTRMASIDIPTFRYRWHDGNAVKDAEQMERYFQANVKAEEQVLCDAGDWRHLLQYLGIFGKVVSERRRAFGYRRVTFATRYAYIRMRSFLGWVRIRREVP